MELLFLFCKFDRNDIKMNTDIHFVNTEKNDSIEELILEKIAKIETKYNWVTGATVFVKGDHHSEGDEYTCEVRISAPGPQIFAETTEKTHNKAVSVVFHELDVLLEKKKDKLYSKR